MHVGCACAPNPAQPMLITKCNVLHATQTKKIQLGNARTLIGTKRNLNGPTSMRLEPVMIAINSHTQDKLRISNLWYMKWSPHQGVSNLDIELVRIANVKIYNVTITINDHTQDSLRIPNIVYVEWSPCQGVSNLDIESVAVIVGKLYNLALIGSPVDQQGSILYNVQVGLDAFV